MKLHQPRLEVVAAGLEVDRVWQSEVADGVGRAGVGVASGGDGRHGRRELTLRRLLREGVAPLERALARLHDPGRGQGRRLRLGAHVVQHHHQDVLAAGRRRRRLAVLEAVDDEGSGVAVPRAATAARFRRQEGRPSVFRGSVGVQRLLTVPQDRLLPHHQQRLVGGRKPL